VPSVDYTAKGSVNNLFQIELESETVVVTPLADLHELVYHEIEEGAEKVLGILNTSPVKNLVMDFHKTDYYGSAALGFFLKLWKRVRERNGRMAFCNVSGHEKEVLQITRLDHLWHLCGSKSEALAKVTASDR
jgi:anti-anti-sigma factor